MSFGVVAIIIYLGISLSSICKNTSHDLRFLDIRMTLSNYISVINADDCQNYKFLNFSRPKLQNIANRLN